MRPAANLPAKFQIWRILAKYAKAKTAKSRLYKFKSPKFNTAHQSRLKSRSKAQTKLQQIYQKVTFDKFSFDT